MNIASKSYMQDLRRYYRLPATQVSLGVVLSLFVMAIFISFALRPTIVSITNLQTTIEESEKTLRQLTSKVNSLQVAATQLEAIKPALPSINASIPNEGAMYSPLTLAIESMAVSTGTQIESESLGPTLLFSRILSPFTPSKKQSVIALPFTLRITGSYQNVREFLNRLLSMERIISLESATISREAGTRNVVGGVSLNVSGSGYYLADEEQLIKAIPEKKGK